MEITLQEAYNLAERGGGILIIRNPIKRGEKAIEFIPFKPGKCEYCDKEGKWHAYLQRYVCYRHAIENYALLGNQKAIEILNEMDTLEKMNRGDK